ncbi:MAG: hypothetical protein NC123_16350 [Butyrivibrio sp.]|nr:hypothetical protein [Butyrivibrio sp.]
MQLYELIHHSFGVCFWTGMSLIAALAMVIMGLVHGHNQKKRNKDFEKDLEEKLDGLNPAAGNAAGRAGR